MFCRESVGIVRLGDSEALHRNSLLTFELRSSFLKIGLDALLTVFAAKSLRQEFSFEGQTVGQGQFETGLYRAFHFANSEAALVRHDELAGIVHDFLHETFFLVDVMNESHLEGFFEGDGFARRAELQSARLANQARQALGAAHARHDAEIDFGEPDAAAFFLGDPDIARHGNLETAADSMAVYRGDNNFRRVFQSHQHFVAVESEIVFKTEGLTGKHVDVGAGRKEFFYLAGQHDGMYVLVKPSLENRRVQFF